MRARTRETRERETTENKRDNRDFQTIKEVFEESFKLPCKVEGDKAKATIKNGVLTLSLPKANGGIAQGMKGEWQ